MTPEARGKLKAFFARFEPGRKPLLLLDYDGTLSRFRVNRFEARPWAGVRGMLERIQRQGSTRMAVITGRPVGEIAPMLGLDPPLEAWGLHGAERLYPDGRHELEQPPAETKAKLEELKEGLRRNALGGLFEDKANGAVMHWRGRGRRAQIAIEKRTRAVFEPLALLDGLSLLEFEAGLELRAGRNKGGAAEAMIAEQDAAGYADAPVAFLGDDLSDEAAFRAVRSLGERGMTALVRREWRETDAELWIKPPEDVRAFLAMWVQAVGA